MRDPGGGGERVELRIERLVAGGAGLARTDRGVVLVDAVAPGDRVLGSIVQRARGLRRAQLLEIIEPGPGRRPEPCPLAGRCGGCDWQHLRYEAQIEAKVELVREAFRRTGGLRLEEAPRLHPSPEWGYRRRARFRLGGASGRRVLGFHGRGSREVVAIGPCPILSAGLESALPELAQRSRRQRQDTLSVLNTDAGVAAETDARGRPRASWRIAVGGCSLGVRPAVFFQANGPLLEPLVARVVELAGGGEKAVDLYAGVGLFSLALGARFERVIAVEGDRSAARLLAGNARGDDRVEVHGGDVAAWLASSAATLAGAVVVVDPPRAGLAPAVREALAVHPPRRLVYVSCDPVTQARDLGDLAAAGMQLGSVELFDLFPQSHHVETVAILSGPAQG